MSRFASHLAAIGIATLVMLGVMQLPPVRSLALPSLFSSAWLLLAVLTLLAQMRRARLFRFGQTVSRQPSKQKVRNRGA